MKKLREEIAFLVMECKKLISDINKFDKVKANELNKRLNKLLNNSENDIKTNKEISYIQAKKNKLANSIENLIFEASLIKEIEDFFENEELLTGRYESLVLDYEEICKKINDLISIDISKSSIYLSKKYDFLYNIICIGVSFGKKLPYIDEFDLEQIKNIVKRNLIKVNPNFSNEINIDDIEEYIKYLNDINNNQQNSIIVDSKTKKNQETNKVDALKETSPKLNIDTSYITKPILSKHGFEKRKKNKIDNFSGYNLSFINFNNMDLTFLDLSGTGAKIDPQKLYYEESKDYKGKVYIFKKRLLFTNLKGLDLRKANFTNVLIRGANLEGTGAKINPQVVLYKDLCVANLKNLDLSEADFTDVNIERANLEGTGAKINPQIIKGKSLKNTNLKGLDLSEADFTGVNIEGANLEGTGAKINPQIIKGKSLKNTNLKGLDLSEADFTGVNTDGANLEETGANVITGDIEEYIKYLKQVNNNIIKEVPIVRKRILYNLTQSIINKDFKRQLSTKEFIKILKKIDAPYYVEKDFTKYDLSFVDFTGVNIEGANLEGTGAKINPQVVLNKNLWHTNLKNLDLSNADFKDVSINGANLEGTGAEIDPQVIWAKNLRNANLKGLDLSDADFRGVIIEGANLEGTGAKINPQVVLNKNLKNTNLKGLDLSEADFTGVDIEGTNLEETGARVIIDGKLVFFERTVEDVKKI